MGAQQSSGQDTGSELVKRCYYEVLEIERQASEEEIKKAYRRKALELHPDRNYGDVENATAKFAEVQTAYEVLSDPQERAWYDSHRESVLRGDSGQTEDKFENNSRLTSAWNIVSLISKFNSSVPFTDAPSGFYGILQQTFADLAKEEESACDWQGLDIIDYPEFGHSADTYEDGVRDFYRVWINFNTKKTFSWKDRYKASDAPDRATRRLIDKENKRFREEGIREFNDAVRSLVAFARKRDPRYTPNSQTEAERQKIIRDAAAAQAARSRAANQAKLNKGAIPKWAQTQQAEEQETFSDSEESVIEEIECVVCRKTFKSEKQYEAHERSKKHIKAVQQLQREMRKDNAKLQLDNPLESDVSTPASEMDNMEINSDSAERDEIESTFTMDTVQADVLDDDVEKGEVGPILIEKSTGGQTLDLEPEPSEIEDEYAPREDVESRITKPLLDTVFDGQLEGSTAAPSVVSDADGMPRLGKAKLKRAKKKAKQESAAQGNQELQCAACDEVFTSKTKLFNHIKELNHAQPLPNGGRGKKKR